MEFTVGIPTHKPGPYIYKCLDSLCRQTMAATEFEVIIVLNGPKDPYFQQIDDYLRQHADTLNARLLHTEVMGVSNARNLILDQAQGDSICFVDDDDFVSDNYLAHFSEALKGSEGCIAIANVKGYDETTCTLTEDYLGRAFLRNKGHRRFHILNIHDLLSTSWCKAIPKAIIAGRRFDTRFKVGEDAIFMFSVSDKIKGARFTTDDTVYYRDLRAGSVLRNNIPVGFFVKNALRLWSRYLAIFFSGKGRYNFPLLVNRLLAVAKSHSKCIIMGIKN
ncbi:MAG: glycosyltransferase family 2 protein [Prevotella sp.]|nr:glycosyltransferase family 2 protein [Prevotella sp.]